MTNVQFGDYPKVDKDSRLFYRRLRQAGAVVGAIAVLIAISPTARGYGSLSEIGPCTENPTWSVTYLLNISAHIFPHVLPVLAALCLFIWATIKLIGAVIRGKNRKQR